MSKDFNQQIITQGVLINELENNVIDIKDNIGKADNEISDADKLDKAANKKTIWIIIGIVFVFLAIGAIVLTMIFT